MDTQGVQRIGNGDGTVDVGQQRPFGDFQDELVRRNAVSPQERRELARKVAVDQLLPGEVHRNPERWTVTGLRPGGELGQRRIQDNVAELADQSRLLRHRDESRRRDLPVQGMDPAGEGLGATQDAGADVHDGLVGDSDVARGHGGAEVLAELQLVEFGQVHVGVVGLHANGAGALGRVHGNVGLLEQVAG